MKQLTPLALIAVTHAVAMAEPPPGDDGQDTFAPAAPTAPAPNQPPARAPTGLTEALGKAVTEAAPEATPSAPAPAPSQAAPAAPLVTQTTATAQYEHRRGVTFEVNLGVGAMTFEQVSSAASAFGIGVGGWLGDRTVLLGRLVGGAAQRTGSTVSQSLIAVGVQRFVGDSWWLAGAIGASAVATDQMARDQKQAAGVEARVGYVFSPAKSHSFTIAGALLSTAGDRPAHTFNLSFGWQLF